MPIAIESVDDDSHSRDSGTPGPSNPITKERVVELCLKHGFYKTPTCNDKLYLHHKGFDRISGLEEYTECRVLWLEGNCIAKLEGLDAMKDSLRSLYLHENMLSSLEGISMFTSLDGLNVSDNQITSLEPFRTEMKPSPLQTLSTLQIKNNKLTAAEELAVLPSFERLSVLDLSSNNLKDGEAVLSILELMPNLKSLKLNGNPFVRSLPNYRKIVLSRCKLLLHLDDRPVFPDERRLVSAWAANGAEGEKREREQIKREEEEKIEQRLAEFRQMVQAAKAERGEADPSESDTDSDSPPENPASTIQQTVAVEKTVSIPTAEKQGEVDDDVSDCWRPG